MQKLYVGGIPFTSREEDMRKHFESVGPVKSVTIIMDKMTGRSKGFGFVEMESADDAAKAIEAFNGKPFEGRNLTVSEARPMEPRR